MRGPSVAEYAWCWSNHCLRYGSRRAAPPPERSAALRYRTSWLCGSRRTAGRLLLPYLQRRAALADDRLSADITLRAVVLPDIATPEPITACRAHWLFGSRGLRAVIATMS